MKLAILSAQYFPILSGVTYHISDIITRLADKYGFDITLYMPQYAHLQPTEMIDNIRIVRCPPIPRFKTHDFCPSMIQQVRQQKFDIIHSYHYGHFSPFAGFLAAIGNVPHIFTPILHPPFVSKSMPILFAFYHIFHGLPMLRFSKKILSLSNHEKSVIKMFGGRNIETVYSPVAIDKVIHPQIRYRDKTVLFVSPFNVYKGADTAFAIARRILKERRDVTFIFIGHGEFEQIFKKDAQKFGKHSFILLDRLHRDELLAYYNLADALILPTKYETFGRVLAESQACRTPVISTRVGSVPEVVIDEKTGLLVDYGNWNEMYEKLSYLLDNTQIIKKMGQTGRQFVKEKFNPKHVVKHHIKIYDDVLRLRT